MVGSLARKDHFKIHPSSDPFTTLQSFDPSSITQDSRANILTSDRHNHRIHIIDQDGHLLRYIHNCGLENPWDLCVGSRDNLFVADFNAGKVEKLQYYK